MCVDVCLLAFLVQSVSELHRTGHIWDWIIVTLLNIIVVCVCGGCLLIGFTGAICFRTVPYRVYLGLDHCYVTKYNSCVCVYGGCLLIGFTGAICFRTVPYRAYLGLDRCA